MISISSASMYQSPYGSAKLQEAVKNQIVNNSKCDTFSSKTKKQVGNALTIGAVIVGGIAAFKNKAKLGALLKKVPEFFARHKSTVDNVVADIPYIEIK